MLKRMWINQPSTSQPYHNLHGTLVLAAPAYNGTAIVYLVHGDLVSQEVSQDCLSPGWPAHLRKD